MSNDELNPAWINEFETALRSRQPTQQLREVVARLLRAGHDRITIQQSLEQFRLTLREADREADEDVVLEVLDFLTGWSSPHQKL